MKRGLHRFVIGVGSAVMLMGILLMFSPTDTAPMPSNSRRCSDTTRCSCDPDRSLGLVPTYYRIPIIALYLAFCFGFLLWPPQKNLAT